MAIARHHYQSGHEEFKEAVKSNPSTSFLRQFSQRLQEVDDFYLPKNVHLHASRTVTQISSAPAMPAAMPTRAGGFKAIHPRQGQIAGGPGRGR